MLVTRGITTVLHYRGAGPNGGIVIGGVHIHHMVFGIILLLGDSYAWLLLTAIDHEHHPRRSRLSAAVYGVAGAPHTAVASLRGLLGWDDVRLLPRPGPQPRRHFQ